MRHVMRWISVGLFLVLSIAACGEERDPLESLDPADRRLLTAASERVRSTGSVKSTVHTVIDIEEGPVVGKLLATGTGVHDFASERSAMTMTFTAPDGDATTAMAAELGKMRVVAEGFVMYVKAPIFSSLVPGSHEWVKMDLVEAGNDAGLDLEGLMKQFGGGDPTAALDYLEGVGDIENEGREDIGGAETTHFTYTMDFGDMAEEMEDLRPTFEKMDELVGGEALPGEVWIDDEGLTRRMSFEMPLTDGSQKGTQLQTMDFHDFGDPISIELPPPRDVVDLLDAMEQ